MYRVRGTVRDKNNLAKLEPIKQAFGSDLYESLEIVEADLLSKDSLTAAINGATFVVHVASPFFYGASDDEMIKPAVDGTLAVMEACKASKTLKRIVVTSSIAAVSNLSKDKRPSEKCTMDESYWSEPDRPEGLSAYAKSKTLAERAAWDFHKSLSEDEKFELVTICPSAVMGPPFRKEGFQSGDTAKKILEGSFETIVNGTDAFVDVRDVSMAHVNAVAVPEAANMRFIAAAETLKWVELAKILAEEFNPKGFKAHTKESEKVDPVETYFDNSASKNILHVTYRPMKETMIDMVNKMIELDMVSMPAST